MLNSQFYDSKKEIDHFKSQLGKLESIVNQQPNQQSNLFLLKQLQNKVQNLESNLESKVNSLISNIIIPDIQPQKLPELQEGHRKRAISTDVGNQSFDIEKKIFLQGTKAGRYQKIQSRQQILNEFNDEFMKQKVDFSFEQNNTQFRYSKVKPKTTQVLVFDAPIPKTKKKIEKKLFQFMIQKGKRIQSIELMTLRQKNSSEWNLINTIITRLEAINLKHQCPTFFVDGRAILSLIHNKLTITISDIVKCILNKEEVIPYFQHRLYLGQEGLERAAEKIQALFKGLVQHKRFQELRKIYRSSLIIQRFHRRKQLIQQTKQRIFSKNAQIYEEYKIRQKEFQVFLSGNQDNWEQIRLMQKVEIHISSLSYTEYQRLTMEKFNQRENQQISRIFRAVDPLTEIVYVSSIELDREILQYYERVFELQGISFKKVRFFTPENGSLFNSHMSLLQKLLYSPKCLKQIKKIIEKKVRYIVPGYPTNEIIQLSHILDSPIYSGIPQNHSLFSSQSGAQVLFSKCKIPTSPGASEIYDEIELFNTLTVLIVKNPNICIWIFKIDGSFEGRGIATINISNLSGLNQIFSQNEQDLDEQSISTIKQLIKVQLPIKLKIAVKSLYKNYQEYLSAFLTSGGMIEAHPSSDRLMIQKTSISFHVSPTYEFEDVCTYDSHSSNRYVQSLFLYPSISSDMDNNKFYEEMQSFFRQKQMFGYFTLNLILFEKQFWAVGLDCYLNTPTSVTFYFDCLSRNQNRIYLYSPIVIHPGLAKTQLKDFFKYCRMEKIQFETEQQVGQTFLFLDILQTCLLQLISLSDGVERCLQLFTDQLNLIFKIAGPLNVSYGESVYESRNDSITILDVQGALKTLKRKLQL